MRERERESVENGRFRREDYLMARHYSSADWLWLRVVSVASSALKILFSASIAPLETFVDIGIL